MRSSRQSFGSERGGADPALTITIGVADFVHLVGGALHPVAALVQKRARVEGDLSLAARLVQMVGAPLPFDLPTGRVDWAVAEDDEREVADIVLLRPLRRSS